MGKLILKSEHRLLCGDSTVKENVDRLMDGEKADMVFTDPPYGIDLVVDYKKRYGKKTSGVKSKTYDRCIEQDNEFFDCRHILEFFDYVKEIFIWGADNYCFSLPRNGSWICWDKSKTEKEFTNFASDFELCWSKQRHRYTMFRKLWIGVKAREETGQEPNHPTRWGHPTQKPIELGLWFFDSWGKNKTNIVDLFGGSGSTLIACEKTDRRCFMMEIDPHYCQVIINRWEDYTGKTAVKI